jgi:hypothetical protein
MRAFKYIKSIDNNRFVSIIEPKMHNTKVEGYRCLIVSNLVLLGHGT